MTLIEVKNLTKEYRLGAMQGIRQTLYSAAAKLRGRETPAAPMFKALDDISFTVDKGEVVGIIGHNGAGKSTLLKMLARITTPTKGTVNIIGRIAPLIEVGAGFIPDFTGRENVYLNGSILGMSRRQIDRKFDEIVEFAEMAEFIDTPVKRYSSGMQVKLAFAVATSVDSEILIVDEVLAVGDLAFQRKCFDRIESLIKRGNRTVLVVSHNLRQVERLCHRVILLDQGRIAADGDPKEVCNLMYEKMDRKISGQLDKGDYGKYGRELSDGSISLISVELVNKDGESLDYVQMRAGATLIIRYLVNKPIQKPIFGVGIHTTDFIYLNTEQSYGSLEIDELCPGIHEISFQIKNMPLLPGVYSFRLGIASGESGGAAFYRDNALHFQVKADSVSRAWNASADEGFFALEAEWGIASEATDSGSSAT